MKKNVSRLDRLPLGTRIVTYLCLAWAAIVALLPLVWLLISSFKEDPLARPGFQLPESLHLEGYISTFRDLNVMQYFGNSTYHPAKQKSKKAVFYGRRLFCPRIRIFFVCLFIHIHKDHSFF